MAECWTVSFVYFQIISEVFLQVRWFCTHVIIWLSNETCSFDDFYFLAINFQNKRKNITNRNMYNFWLTKLDKQVIAKALYVCRKYKNNKCKQYSAQLKEIETPKPSMKSQRQHFNIFRLYLHRSLKFSAWKLIARF